MPLSLRSALVPAAFVALAGLVPAPARAEGDAVAILVLKEHGVGSAAQAQPFVDKLVSLAGKQNGWAGAKGSYQTTRTAAEKYIQDAKPHFGILSLAAFLALRTKHNLDVVGQVAAARAGGQQYFVVSKTAGELEGCKGKRLASDHADDPKFIDKVLSGGKFKLSDFTVVNTTRPIQTIKKVMTGEAECALIDDAQQAELSHIDGGTQLKAVWQSDKLPPLVVTAFPAAPAAQRKAFQASFAKLCDGEGKAVCAEVGLQSIRAASASDYSAIFAQYDK